MAHPWSKSFTTLSEIPREFHASFLSIPEAKRLSSIPESDIRHAIADGTLRFFMRYSGQKLIRVDSLRYWVSARTCVANENKPSRPKKTTVIGLPRAQKLARFRAIAREPLSNSASTLSTSSSLSLASEGS